MDPLGLAAMARTNGAPPLQHRRAGGPRRTTFAPPGNLESPARRITRQTSSLRGGRGGRRPDASPLHAQPAPDLWTARPTIADSTTACRRSTSVVPASTGANGHRTEIEPPSDLERTARSHNFTW